MTDVYHHSLALIEMESVELFAWTGLELGIFLLLPPE
jgi:hypothetical protein